MHYFTEFCHNLSKRELLFLPTKNSKWQYNPTCKCKNCSKWPDIDIALATINNPQKAYSKHFTARYINQKGEVKYIHSHCDIRASNKIFLFSFSRDRHDVFGAMKCHRNALS